MNGRVDVIENYNYDRYKLFEDNNQRDDYGTEAIKGAHASNMLANIYFSQHNIDLLQDAIRYLVYTHSGKKYTISRQSDTELKIIMRSQYLQNGVHKQYDQGSEVKALNTMVLDIVVPQIIQEINMYMRYKREIGRNVIPIDRGEFISSKGTRTLEHKQFF